VKDNFDRDSAMEVLLRYQCPCSGQPKEGWLNARCSYWRCSYCHGRGYLQGWVPYSLLADIQALFKDIYVVMARRRYPVSSPALSWPAACASGTEASSQIPFLPLQFLKETIRRICHLASRRRFLRDWPWSNAYRAPP